MSGRQKELESLCQRLQTESGRLEEKLQRTNDELTKERARKQASPNKDDELKLSLLSQLDKVSEEHRKKMEELQDNFLKQAGEASSPRRVHFKNEAPSECALVPEPGEYALVPEPDALEVEAGRGVGWRELHDREEQRALLAKDQLQRAQTEMSELKAATDEQVLAAAEFRQDLLETKQAQDALNEEKSAELLETRRKSEILQQTQEALERDAKALQRQLSKAEYDVGKKDREQQLKEAELHEVRLSITTIQDEMDEVNRQLQAQCGRVQRVESSLRLSRDLGSKVQSMREMLRESHAALGQLCNLVENERAQKGECSQGLRQQQMRTELLLQLLSHFKSRTQDLAPQVLLSQATELIQGQAGAVQPGPSVAFPSEPVVASSFSTVPPSQGGTGR